MYNPLFIHFFPGVYHQFDDLIFPNIPTRSWLPWNQPPRELEFTPMELFPMRTLCLQGYLGLILRTLGVESLPITTQAESILAVYRALSRRSVADSGGVVFETAVDLTLVSNFSTCQLYGSIKTVHKCSYKEGELG